MSSNSIDDRLDKLLDEYWEKFEDMFPTMNFQDETKKQICERIEQCIKQNKTARELFDLDEGYKY